ncbi:MAG: YebC/PmpR family DNA-binding transcriptional regulator [bacterium]|nr:YebC/PmpR family DNA-binding transcriptional regulator [bacterium]
MSGHSKWAGIKHKKAIVDEKRGKLFSKLIREITVSARMGGGDLQGNSRLRQVVEKAKGYNMPQENIKRAIQRGTGELPGVVVEEAIYEGYGPGGVAILIEALTDNKNRTTARIRSLFSKYNGNLGESGCVSWMFTKKGYITLDKSDISEDELLDIVSEWVEDIKAEEDTYEIITIPQDFEAAKESLEKRVNLKYAEITMLPQSYIKVDEKTAKTLLSFIEALEEDEDVNHVYANFDIPTEILQEVTRSD